MTLQQHIDSFKRTYGDGEFKIGESGQVELPLWLAAMLLHLSGIKSKKMRVQKKVIKREVNALLERHFSRKHTSL